jgi:hypothetical protein
MLCLLRAREHERLRICTCGTIIASARRSVSERSWRRIVLQQSCNRSKRTEPNSSLNIHRLGERGREWSPSWAAQISSSHALRAGRARSNAGGKNVSDIPPFAKRIPENCSCGLLPGYRLIPCSIGSAPIFRFNGSCILGSGRRALVGCGSSMLSPRSLFIA